MSRLFAAIVVLAVAAAGLPVEAAANELRLVIRDGRVDLDARDVPVTRILEEWARVGQTRIVDGEDVPGGPVTLRLDGVPEREALDIILRSAAGYLAARRAAADPALSSFDRIVVLARSTAQPVAPAPPPTPAMGPGQPGIFRQPGLPGRLEMDEMGEQDYVPDDFAPDQFAPDEFTDFGEFVDETTQPDTPQPQNRFPRLQPWGTMPAPAPPGAPFSVPPGTSPVPGVIIQPPAPPTPEAPPLPPDPPDS